MSDNNEATINITLTVEEVNAVIAVLAQLPFNQVHALLNNIRNQAIQQLQAKQPVADDTPEESTAE